MVSSPHCVRITRPPLQPLCIVFCLPVWTRWLSRPGTDMLCWMDRQMYLWLFLGKYTGNLPADRCVVYLQMSTTAEDLPPAAVRPALVQCHDCSNTFIPAVGPRLASSVLWTSMLEELGRWCDSMSLKMPKTPNQAQLCHFKFIHWVNILG